MPIKNRILALQTLKKVIQAKEEKIYQALQEDLGKSKSESYMCEVGMVYGELNYMLRHIRQFSRKKRKITPIAQAISKSYVMPVPKGNVLIMSPWNYPFLLTMDPLVDALAAGNCVMIKPSAYAPTTGKIIQEIIKEAFSTDFVSVITGGRLENQALLNQKFNHIFFTGSQGVGKEVLKKAADHLTSVTLELGGKSPCIIEKTADIAMAAKRIVFGKYLNCGQTCVAPDYILCDESVVETLKNALVNEIKGQFGEEPLKNNKYGKIINQKHFSRLSSLADKSTIYYGGGRKEATCQIEPTLIFPCEKEEAIMQEEIFGPLLPILTYQCLDEAIDFIASGSCPLALYIFSKNRENIYKVTEKCSFGGGCVNDTVIHLATSRMGFGGFQESGMGSYHGKEGFDTFTHYKSMVDKKTWLDLPMRYQPYTRLHDSIIKLFLR